MNNELILIDDEKVELIKRTVAKDATNDELALFLHQARRMGLDPLARQIHFQKYKGKDGKSNVSFITTIDGYRLIADRTGKYAGNKEPVFEGKINDSQYGASNGPDIPAKATVTIYKIVGGALREFSNSAYWKEYYPGEWKGHMWRKMPHVMLAKVAEAGALRKAFPADLSGAYTDEEMQQSDIVAGDIIDAPHVDIKREKQRLAVVADADIERDEAMTNDDLEPTPEPTSAKPAPVARKRQTQQAPATNGNPKITPVMRREMHALGTFIYKKEWDKKRAEASEAFGKSSSNDWTLDEYFSIVEPMKETKKRMEAENDKHTNGWDELTGEPLTD